MGLGRSRHTCGFTLVEVAVVVVILGVLAAFGVPRVFKSVERSKAAEAIAYLQSIRSAQVLHHARFSTYCDGPTAALDVPIPTPKYFVVGTFTPGATGSLEDSWSLTLTRTGASSAYGSYTVTFTQDGYDRLNSTIDSLPDILPML